MKNLDRSDDMKMDFAGSYPEVASRLGVKMLLSLITAVSLMTLAPSSHADFRKALDAYFARDGVTMLREVRNAVESGKYDGFILFLSMLERDSVFSQNSAFILNDENIGRRKPIEKTMGIYGEDDIPWRSILSQGESKEFLDLLQKASEGSALESQFRLINLRSPYGIYDMVDYTEISKVDVSKRSGSNIYRNHYTLLARKGYSEILYFLTQFGVASKEEKERRVQDFLNSTHTRSLLLRAVGLLTQNTNKATEAEGLHLMKSALSRPDASYFYADIAEQMSAYYLKRGDKASLKQAYLWALVELTQGQPYYDRDYFKPIKSLVAFKRADGFKKIGLTSLDMAWNKNTPTQQWDYRNLPDELKGIRQIEMPELISKNQDINLKTQPVLSFHRFNYDAQIVPFGISAKNYLIDIYADGRVNLSVGARFDRTQNQETLLILPQRELNDLLADSDRLGIENVPLSTLTKANCGLGGCSEDYSKLGGSSSTYYITKRNQAGQRTVIYYLIDNVEELPIFPAKVFELLEKRLHTQQYRCGSVKDRAYYKLCVDFDTKSLAIANQGEISPRRAQ